MVAYVPTEEAPEGQKARYMAALNSTVASVPTREYVFDFTDAYARTGKRGKEGGETDSKVLGACGQDVLNENEKTTAEDSKLALRNIFVAPPKMACTVRSKTPTIAGTSTFGLFPDQAGGPSTGPLR